MTVNCPFITCGNNTENGKGDYTPRMGQCKKETITLQTPGDTEEFRDQEWGKV